MKDDRLALHTFWGPRKEESEECARRLVAMLRVLLAIHPAFAHWNRLGDTDAEMAVPFCAMPPRLAELARIFDENRYYTDRPRALMPELGFSVGAWNGHPDPLGAAMYANPGGYRTDNRGSNSVSFHLNGPMPGNESLINATTLSRMLLFATHGQFDNDNPAHVAAANAVQRALHPDAPRPSQPSSG